MIDFAAFSDELIKIAADVEETKNGPERGIADSIGHLGALQASLLIQPGNLREWHKGLTPAEARAVVARMERKHGKSALKGVKIRLGGTNIRDDFRRMWSEDGKQRSSSVERGVATVALPLKAIVAGISRADHYDSDSDTITSYSGNPHVLAHEIGHAIDFNEKSQLARSAYSNTPRVIGMAGSALEKVAPVAKPISGAARSLYSLPIEARATSKALESYDNPREADAARNVLLPAFGSYAGVAGSGLYGLAKFKSILRDRAVLANASASPASKLKASKSLLKASLITAGLGLGGVAAGHVAARGYNAIRRARAKNG